MLKKMNFLRAPHAIVSRVFIILTLCAFWGCEEHRWSDKPVTLAEARKGSEITLPLPESATEIRYSLFGETQNWDLYISYSAPKDAIDKIIQKEIASYQEDQSRLSEPDQARLNFKQYAIKDAAPLPSREFLWSRMRIPRWWAPEKIKKGYYIGSLDPDYGPRFWVDEENSRVFYFEHF